MKHIAKEVRERKRKMMDENKGLVEEIQLLMANDDAAAKKHEEYTNNFRVLERSDIMIRNEMKHTLQKVTKAKQSIEDIQQRKQKMIEENNQNEKLLPQREEELKALQQKKIKVEEDFEKEEVRV